MFVGSHRLISAVFTLSLDLLLLFSFYKDDEGDNAFHIAADAAKMIRENLDWLIVMLKRPDAAVDVRNHRQALIIYTK